MVNIIISILLLNLIVHYITKTPYTALSCGIWGYFGENNKRFNWKDFNIIGIINDKRGGDAAGRMVGKNYEHYNTRHSDKYTDIIRDLLNPDYKNENVIFGHTRKTSATAFKTDGIEFTQPYPVRDATGVVIGMGMHNGTLYNAAELKRKYDVPDKLEYVKGDEVIEHEPNDSQTLFYALLIKEDYSILENYQGSAALAWFDFREDRLYLYRGASKNYEAAKVLSDERPLYVLQEKNNLWFSSEDDPLWIISQKRFPDITSLNSNEIHVYEKGVLINTIEIERKSGQYRKTYNSYGSVDYWSKNERNYSGYKKPASLPAKTKDEEETNVKIEQERVPSLHSSIAYAKGRYWDSDGKKAHGILHLDKTGKICSSPSGPNASEWTRTVPYYFIDGCMITDHEDFQNYMRQYKNVLSSNKEDFIQRKLVKVSVYPVHKYGEDGSMSHWDARQKTWWYYSGEITPLFSAKIYKYTRGSLIETKLGNWRFADHSESSSEYYHKKFKEDEATAAEDAYEQAYKDYEDSIKNDIFNEKLPFDDDYESAEDELIKQEVVNELANALKGVQDCMNAVQIFAGSKIGDKAIAALEETEDKLSELGNK